MTRLLFVTGTALGHISRLMTVASELKKTGPFEIIFAAPFNIHYGEIIETADYQLHRVDKKKTDLGGAQLDFDTIAGQLELLIDQIDPAAIVVDTGLLELYSVMQWPDIPRILITNVFVTRMSSHKTLQSNTFAIAKDAINARRELLGLNSIQSATDFYEADLVCLADPKQLVRQFGPLPDNYRSCGTSFWESGQDLPATAPDIDSAVLFSMGSTGRTPVTREMVAHLKQVTGAGTSIYAGRDAAQISAAGIVDYAAPMLPLQHFYPRVKLAITQGGAGSSYQALSYGVPVAILPSHRNHEVLGEELEKLGIAKLIRNTGDVLDFRAGDFETMAQNARQFADQSRNECGAKQIAREIGEFLKMPRDKPETGARKPVPLEKLSRNRAFRYAKTGFGTLANNGAHNFALGHTMMIYGANACYSWIPKNGCSTLRFSISRANGCISDLSDINWIHSNNQSFRADTESAFRASYTFTIIRCPYARLYSAYMDKMVNFDLPSWKFFTACGRKIHPHDLTFKKFVSELSTMNTTGFDMHWRRQSDFMLFKNYDRIFALEKFDDFTTSIRNRIGLEIIDTRKAVGHDTSNLSVDSDMAEPFNAPAIDLLMRARQGVRPSPQSMYDLETASAVKEIYKRDLFLYRKNFGNSELMDILD